MEKIKSKFKNFSQKIFEIVGKDVGIRERMFRVILIVAFIVSLLAIISGLWMDNMLYCTVPLLVLLAIIVIALYVTFRYRKIEAFSTLFGAIIILVIFPIMFFVSGGIYGGATVWFALGIVYTFLMFSGKKMFGFLALTIIVDVLTYVIGYNHNELITALESESAVYSDSLFAVLAVGITMGYLMRYQIRIYELQQKKAEEQKQEIEQLSISQNSFFTNVSHEIRTPINTILGLNEMIMREDISDEVRENADNIQSAGKMLLSLVNDILDMSKIENGKMEIVPIEYQIKQMISDLVGMVWPRIHEKKLELAVDVDESLPSVLYGDAKRLSQVMLNILTNAVKYTNEGMVRFSVTGEMLDDKSIQLRMSVSDTGIGIKKDDIDTLYDSFHRVNLKQNWKVEGNGLGLSISKQLLDLMGGTISVDSIYMKGSVFTVTVEQPVVNSAPIGKFDYLKRNHLTHAEPYKPIFEAPEAVILVVDDNEQNLLVYSKLLRSTGMQIDTALGSSECLNLTNQKYYHLIIMDYMMPERNGAETLQLIRSQADGMCRETPVIAITASNIIGEEQTYIEQGFSSCLSKPVDGKTLEAEILSFLPSDIVDLEQENSLSASSALEDIQSVVQKKRRKIMITSDSACDLPADLRDYYNIHLICLYVQTDRGTFRDTKEIDSDNLFHYLSNTESFVRAVAASVEEYEAFYSQMLTEADEIVHISLGSNYGDSYHHALQASYGFDHVHVIDSEQISGGVALMVLSSAKLAKDNRSIEDIRENIAWIKERSSVHFWFPSIRIFSNNGYGNAMAANLCELIHAHPVLKTRHGNIRIYSLTFGKNENAINKFIRRIFLLRKNVDTDIVYVTHVGCNVKELEKIKKEILKYVPFDRVIIQKTSVANGCNSGIGTIGIAYIKSKNSLE